MLKTSDLIFKKDTGTLHGDRRALGIARYPCEVWVVSPDTGRTVKFVQNTEAAMAAGYWDGEEMHYLATETDIKAKALVLTAYA